MAKSNLLGKALFHITGYSPLLREVRALISSRQKLMQRPCSAPCWVAPRGFLSLPFHTIQEHLPRLAPSTESWALPHQDTGLFHGGIFSVNMASSRICLGLRQLTKPKQHRGLWILSNSLPVFRSLSDCGTLVFRFLEYSTQQGPLLLLSLPVKMRALGFPLPPPPLLSAAMPPPS